jgi:hypothetical protein
VSFRKRGYGKGIPSIFFITGFIIYLIDSVMRILIIKINSFTFSAGFIIGNPNIVLYNHLYTFLGRFHSIISDPFTLYPLMLVSVLAINAYIVTRYSRTSKRVEFTPMQSYASPNLLLR